jgi:membrane protein
VKTVCGGPLLAHGGSIVGGILLSLLRNLFGWYVSAFPTYQNVYSALSVVPIFLIWRYMSWGVVLLGAIITTTTLGTLQAGGRQPSGGMAGTGQLNDAFAVLAILVRASRTGEVTQQSQLLRQPTMAEDQAESTLEVL